MAIADLRGSGRAVAPGGDGAAMVATSAGELTVKTLAVSPWPDTATSARIISGGRSPRAGSIAAATKAR
jgi:hypothetical protein